MDHIIRGKWPNFEDIYPCSGKGGYLHGDRRTRGLVYGYSSHVLITLTFAPRRGVTLPVADMNAGRRGCTIACTIDDATASALRDAPTYRVRQHCGQDRKLYIRLDNKFIDELEPALTNDLPVYIDCYMAGAQLLCCRSPHDRSRSTPVTSGSRIVPWDCHYTISTPYKPVSNTSDFGMACSNVCFLVRLG